MRISIILFSLLLAKTAGNCQPTAVFSTQYKDHSGISIPSQSPQSYKNIEVLCKVWGFLKYYHPFVRKGKVHWDIELFRILPKLYYKPDQIRDSILLSWIKQFPLGEQIGKDDLPHSDIRLYPDLDWIQTSGLDKKLVTLLALIATMKKDSLSYYVSLGEIPKPDFKSELSYSRFTYPDEGYRILALFRYWNIIKYYYPYRYLLAGRWDTILPIELKKFAAASNELQYKLDILELITLLNDSHATIEAGGEIIEHYKGDNFVPVRLKFINGRVVVSEIYDSIAERSSGLLLGDIILSIEGKSIDRIVRGRIPFTPASKDVVKLREIADELLRTNKRDLTVEVKRNNSMLILKLKCKPISSFDINFKYNRKDTCCKIIGDSIGYLNPLYINAEDIEDIMNRLFKTRGIILDFRYPVKDNILSIGNYLLSDVTDFAKMTCPSTLYPGLFTYFKTMTIGGKVNRKYQGMIILLIDENSQSSSEFNAMAFRMYKGTITLGSPTAGTDGDVVDVYLPGGVLTSFTGLGVYHNDGRETQRIGISPDILLKPSLNGVLEGRDEVLEYAIKLILSH
jgi:hypothetical protein